MECEGKEYILKKPWTNRVRGCVLATTDPADESQMPGFSAYRTEILNSINVNTFWTSLIRNTLVNWAVSFLYY
jgi:hypothetical protein